MIHPTYDSNNFTPQWGAALLLLFAALAAAVAAAAVDVPSSLPKEALDTSVSSYSVPRALQSVAVLGNSHLNLHNKRAAATNKSYWATTIIEPIAIRHNTWPCSVS